VGPTTNFVVQDVNQTVVLQIVPEAEDMTFVIESSDIGKVGIPLNAVAELWILLRFPLKG
jgi:hypothetical protein